jgi:hypothetical protein
MRISRTLRPGKHPILASKHWRFLTNGTAWEGSESSAAGVGVDSSQTAESVLDPAGDLNRQRTAPSPAWWSGRAL